MQKMQMNIQKYQAFVKAVEYGSFTEAGAALHYTQSGISRMIGDLEAEWGVSLLERGRTGVKLTSDGLKLLPQLQRICNEHETLLLQVDDLHGMQSGLIRIGTFSSVATHWLPKMIAAFRQDYPKIEFELLIGDYTEIEGWILAGRVDVGFLRLPAKAELETIFLEEDRLLVVLPQDHPLAGCASFPSGGWIPGSPHRWPPKPSGRPSATCSGSWMPTSPATFRPSPCPWRPWARNSSSGCGRNSRSSPMARPAATCRSPGIWAIPRAPGPWAAPWAPTPSRSSSPATEWWAPMAI